MYVGSIASEVEMGTQEAVCSNTNQCSTRSDTQESSTIVHLCTKLISVIVTGYNYILTEIEIYGLKYFTAFVINAHVWYGHWASPTLCIIHHCTTFNHSAPPTQTTGVLDIEPLMHHHTAVYHCTFIPQQCGTLTDQVIEWPHGLLLYSTTIHNSTLTNRLVNTITHWPVFYHSLVCLTVYWPEFHLASVEVDHSTI